MTTLYEINTRNKGKKEELDEPIDMDNDLEERLYSTKNMIDLAILALYSCQELLPTALEEAYYKLQKLVDDYCIIHKEA